MSQESMYAMSWAMPLGALRAIVRVQISVPTNPPEIVTVSDSGFSVDTNKMAEYTPCLVEFMNSQYTIWKEKSGALVVVDRVT